MFFKETQFWVLIKISAKKKKKHERKNILNEKLPKLIWWRKIELQNNILIKLTQESE
jgi:hypothetical protein